MALNDSISDVAKTMYSNTVYELTQQTKARTRGFVDMEPLTGKEKMLDRVGHVEMQEANERYPEVIPVDFEWDRRRLSGNRVVAAFFIDEWDTQKILMDPASIYAKRTAEAFERYFDRTTIAATTATVYTGEHGTTAVTAATDGIQTVDATAGLTYEKLLETDENFQQYEIGTETPIRKGLFISEQEHTQLMKESELVSGDFSRRYVIDAGQMVRALDFELVVYGSAVPIPMLPVTAGVRQCIAMAAGAVKIGLAKELRIKVQERTDRHDTTQLVASGIIGGVRMEAPRIQKVNTTAA